MPTRPQPNPYSEFLATITHEFRTPLAGLRASIELLQRDVHYLSRQETDELIGSLYLSVGSLETLVDNLLESARIESGHFSLKRRRISPNDVLSEAIRITQPLLERRQQTLALAEPILLPTLNADPVRLVQVIVNLLSNACNYSPFGTEIEIMLAIPTPETLSISVADRGSGVSEEIKERLFQRFVRYDVGNENEAGIGLGLAVVKAIVEGHGGAVGVNQRDGGGSIFWFTLPLAA